MSLSSTMISLSSYQLPCPLIQQSVLLVTQRRESFTPSPMISPGIYELLTRILSSPNSNRGNCECTAVRSKNSNTTQQTLQLTDLCSMRAHYDPHPLSGHAHNACIASRLKYFCCANLQLYSHSVCFGFLRQDDVQN